MRIVSWNVNGLRACAKKGFLDFLDRCDADVVALQETRAFEDQLEERVASPEGWHTYFHPAERPGYSGVAIYSRQKPSRVETSLGVEEFDAEGRYLCVTYGRLAVASVYFPNGSGKDRDNSRVPYKLDFYREVFSQMQRKRKNGPVYIAGDYNTAHHEIDLARPKENSSVSGFLPIERQWIDKLIENNFVDTFRIFDKNPDNYTWWNMRTRARDRNVGWRIDYFFVSDNLVTNVKSSSILSDVMGSDHCPIKLNLSF